MHIKPLIIIDTAIIGGPGRGLLQLLKVLQKRSMSYLLCTFRYRKPKSNEFVAATEKNQIKLVQVRQRFRLDPSPVWQLFKIARRDNYSLVQSHGYKSHLVALLVAKLLRVPWIAFSHGWTSEDFKVKMYHRLDLLLLKYADVVVAVSPKLADTFKKIRGSKKRTELILNAVDTDAIEGAKGGAVVRSELNVAKEDILIGCIGRLSFEKGQDVLLRAFSIVAKKDSRLKLLFVGDGIDRERLLKNAAELGINERVLFERHALHVRDYYEAIDLLVLPSRSEGLPNVVLEAMCFSVPVIATKVGAVEEIITEGRNGWIVPSGNDRALADAIAKVASDETLRQTVGKAGLTSLHPKFCAEARAQKIIDLYAEICSQKARSSKDISALWSTFFFRCWLKIVTIFASRLDEA